MKPTGLDFWEFNYLWNLCNDDLGNLISNSREKEPRSERIVNLMNKLDTDYVWGED